VAWCRGCPASGSRIWPCFVQTRPAEPAEPSWVTRSRSVWRAWYALSRPHDGRVPQRLGALGAMLRGRLRGRRRRRGCRRSGPERLPRCGGFRSHDMRVVHDRSSGRLRRGGRGAVRRSRVRWRLLLGLPIIEIVVELQSATCVSDGVFIVPGQRVVPTEITERDGVECRGPVLRSSAGLRVWLWAWVTDPPPAWVSSCLFRRSRRGLERQPQEDPAAVARGGSARAARRRRMRLGDTESS
jgi:hypothetical protein